MAQISEKTLVIFDFDGTVYNGDSFIDFAIAACGKWKVFLALVMTVPAIIAWKSGFITNGEAKQSLFRRLYKGMKYEQFKQSCEAFAIHIDRNLNIDVASKLYAAGGNAVIASASIGDWIRPWAMRHGVREVIATEIEICEDRLTGKFRTPNCFGKEKVRRIWEKIQDFTNYHKVVYTDSISADAPMIAMADEYVIVNNLNK